MGYERKERAKSFVDYDKAISFIQMINRTKGAKLNKFFKNKQGFYLVYWEI